MDQFMFIFPSVILVSRASVSSKFYYLFPSTSQELLSDWSIYLSVLHMIGWSMLNERLPDITPPNGM
jgi:hypothetical protein